MSLNPNDDKSHRPLFDQEANSSKPKPQQAPAKRRASSGVPSVGEANARAAAKNHSSNSPASKNVYYSSSSGKRPASGRAVAVRQRKPPARKGKKLKAALIIVLAVLLAIVLAVVIFYSIMQGRMDGRNTDAGVVPVENNTERLFPEYEGAGIINFLVCGIDYDDENAASYTTAEKVGRTDLVLYCNYDTIENKLAIMQIPRDTYVGDKVETGNNYRINGLYFNAKDKENRIAALSNVLASQFQLPVDFYITIDMDALKEIIDIKGTINVYVPVDIDDPENPTTFIAKGWREFTGAEAEVFLRNRHSTAYKQQGDIARMQTQQYFYSALFREFKSLAAKDLYMWMDVLTYRIKTDKDLLYLGSLASKALSIKSEDITFVRPPCGTVMYKGESVLSLVADDTADLLNEYFRMDGHTVPVKDLDILELPMYQGVVPASIRTMGEVQSTEAPMSESKND